MTGEIEDLRRHWDALYGRKGAAGVSWYQPTAHVSLELIDRLGIPPTAAMIDVGGGASTLVDDLLARGFSDVTVLDVSTSALDAARTRLGGKAAAVHWLHEDLLHAWMPARRYDLWHDRAVFHFLVAEGQKARYRALLDAALAATGVAIVATFAPDGPDHCSGLPVSRYGQEELVAALGEGMELLMGCREEHRTPGGVAQPFTWVAVRRRHAGTTRTASPVV